MLDDEVVLLDDLSIRHAGFSGVSAELRGARNHLADGDGRGAVDRAGSALESVMMTLLDADRAKADAHLANDLAASFCYFLVELKLARDGESQVEVSEPAPLTADNTDVGDFSFAGSAEDNIPL